MSHINNDGTPTYPTDPDHPYATNDLLWDTTPGIAGQNMTTPAAKLFDKHFIVHVDATYYDPSYGTQSGSAMEFSTGAIAYWGDRPMWMGPHWCQRAAGQAAEFSTPGGW